jgi:hypothetical protein
MSITFREFVELVEGKKKKKLEQPNPEPPNAVPGTYQEHPDGYKTYTLKPAKPFKKPLSKNEISKKLEKQGGIGGGAVRRALKKREEQQEGFSIKKSQEELEKKRKEAEKQKQQERQQRSSELYHERTRGPGMVSYEKDESGVVRRGRRKDGKFTPDADT